MLSFKNVSASYGQSQVLFNLNLEVEKGSVTTLLGNNGMGKTTTVRTLFGLTHNITGDILLDGESINGLKPFQIARRGVALVPEGRQVFPTLTVIENLIATSKAKSATGRKQGLDSVFNLFPLLAERRRSYGGLLSGGEQQMLAIGRALLTEPRLLVLDEATEGLAPTIRRVIWAALKKLKEESLSILIIDKNLKPLCRLGDKHNVIQKGQIAWTGYSDELLDPSSDARALLRL